MSETPSQCILSAMKDVEGERFDVPVSLTLLLAFQISLPLAVMRNEAHVQLVRALSR